MKRTVDIQYFAILREERGSARESYETEARTYSDLYDELRKKYHFSLGHDRLKVACNNEFRKWDDPLTDRDRIVFIPPVAGG